MKGQPSQFQGSGITAEETGRKMYLMRRSTGLPWVRIAEDFDVSENVACQYARRFAIRFGAIWPISTQVKRRRVIQLGESIYYKASFDASQGCLSFEALGQDLSISADLARRYAHDFAEALDKPWPIPCPHVPGWGEISYDLRVESNAIRTWVSIQEEVGFKHTTHCIASARKWAQKNDLPWPIVGTEDTNG